MMRWKTKVRAAAVLAVCAGAAAVWTGLALAEQGRGGLGAADKDGDGQLSREEFLDTRRGEFRERDADGDGVLSEDEFLAQFVTRFEAADANGDDTLSRDELRSMFQGLRGRRGER